MKPFGFIFCAALRLFEQSAGIKYKKRVFFAKMAGFYFPTS